MRNLTKIALLLLAMMLALSLNALTGCSLTKSVPPVIMPESKTVKLEVGNPAPFSGWLLSGSAMEKLLEMAERCDEK